MQSIKVLGIETSCDETAAAVVTADRVVLSNLVLSRLDEHSLYGGVVPEFAARAHIEHLDGLVGRAVVDAGLDFHDLDAVAVTAGPGLIGGVLVGLVTAKAIAAASGLPLVAVNHLEGHALSARLCPGIDFPFLLLLVTGGHCQLVEVEGVGAYRVLGTTVDDAVGEAFDKVARMLGYGYPGGPEIEAAAATGDAERFSLPRPLLGRDGYDFSFSGLKTAVRRHVESVAPRGDRFPERGVARDVAASFQAAVADVLVDRSGSAMEFFAERHDGRHRFAVAGGVAANTALRRRLLAAAEQRGFELVAPPAWLCTDNAAMIAWAGVERYTAGHVDALDVAGRARWQLEVGPPQCP